MTAGLHAAPIFTDNFNGVAAGNPPDATNWTTTLGGTGGSYAKLVADTANKFGGGSSNQYLELAPRGGGGTNTVTTKVASSFSDDILTISFDFVEPNDLRISPINLQVGRGSFNNTTKFLQLSLNNNTLTATNGGSTSTAGYSYGQKAHVDVVINASVTSTSYGSNSLSANAYDVWLDGSRVITGAANFGSGTSGNISFAQFNGAGNGTLQVDNFVIDSAAVVPEPATTVGVLGGLLGTLVLRRRR